MRAIPAAALLVYMVETVYSNVPRNMLMVAAVWPVAFTFCVIGLTYGVLGLRRDERKRAAVCGVVLHALLICPVIFGTWEAATTIYQAFRYDGGIIWSADR